MDADDVSLPQRLELQVAVLEGSSQIGVIGGQMIAVDLTGSHLWPTAYPSDDTSIRSRLASDNPFGHPTVVMRKDVFEACGGYRDACLHAEDYDLWVRMLDRCRGANLNQTVLLYRVHAGQTAFRDWRQHCLSTLAVQAATRIRRTERRDPLQATGRISEETVRDLGVPDEAVRTRFVESLLALSNVASHVGSRPDRHRLLTQAEAEASRGPIPADTMARLALVQALTAFEDRAPATGTAALIRSVRADRRAAAELGVAWLYRRHPAIFKTLAAVRKLSGRPSWGAT